MLINNEFIYVIEYPVKKAKATVIFTHGIAEHQLKYLDFVKYLNDNNYNVITYDVRGHGRSGGRRGYVKHVNLFVEDLRQLVEYTKEKFKTKVYLIGHSMGALITNLYVINYPEVDGVIITGATATFNKQINFLRYLPWQPFWFINIKTNFFDPNLQDDIPSKEEIMLDSSLLDKFNIRLIYETMIRGLRVIRKNMRNIELPYLILHGSNDKIIHPVSSKVLYNAIKSKDKKYIEFPKMKHNILNVSTSEPVLLNIVNWLDERNELK